MQMVFRGINFVFLNIIYFLFSSFLKLVGSMLNNCSGLYLNILFVSDFGCSKFLENGITK